MQCHHLHGGAGARLPVPGIQRRLVEKLLKLRHRRLIRILQREDQFATELPGGTDQLLKVLLAGEAPFAGFAAMIVH